MTPRLILSCTVDDSALIAPCPCHTVPKLDRPIYTEANVMWGYVPVYATYTP